MHDEDRLMLCSTPGLTKIDSKMAQIRCNLCISLNRFLGTSLLALSSNVLSLQKSRPSSVLNGKPFSAISLTLSPTTRSVWWQKT